MSIRLVFLLLLRCPLCFNAQEADTTIYDLQLAESELAQLQPALFHSRVESERLEANKKFIGIWDRIASNPQIINYKFTSLKDISILDSKDELIRVVTWNLFRNDGTHIYFGYLFVNQREKVKTGLMSSTMVNDVRHHKLTDRSMLIKNPETHVGPPDKWFGMLYTQIIDCGEFYSLIGWDGNNRITQRKFVDILWLKEDGSPVFGKDVFSVPKKVPKRLMFEYSSEVSMSLKYDEKRRQIVYSHLAPRTEGDLLEGQFQYYGPDGSFDALELGRDRWRHLRWQVVEDIDARNAKNRNDDAPKPDPKKQKPVYVPK